MIDQLRELRRVRQFHTGRRGFCDQYVVRNGAVDFRDIRSRQDIIAQLLVTLWSGF